MSPFIFVTNSTPSRHKGYSLILRDVADYSEILATKMSVRVLKRASGTDYKLTEQLIGGRTIVVTVVREGSTKY